MDGCTRLYTGVDGCGGLWRAAKDGYGWLGIVEDGGGLWRIVQLEL